MTNSRGRPASSCTAVSPRDSTDQTIAAKMIPIGLFRARNATAMPLNPEQRLVVLHERPSFHQQLLHPDQAGEGAADEEDLDLDRADPDPARLCGARRGADGAGLVPEAHPAEEEPDPERCEDREREQPRELGGVLDPEERSRGAV